MSDASRSTHAEGTRDAVSGVMGGVVLGARPGSLGAYVASQTGYEALGPGLPGANGKWSSVGGYSQAAEILGYHPRVIIDTVGINMSSNPEDFKANGPGREDMVFVNYIDRMRFAEGWFNETKNLASAAAPAPMAYVVVSSNSAHIARSPSSGYCASKAALSMGMRSFARWLATNRHPHSVSVIEPGWMNGTPMSQEIGDEIGHHIQPHRIPGDGSGVSVEAVGDQILLMVSYPRAFNGCTIRLDGGEQ